MSMKPQVSTFTKTKLLTVVSVVALLYIGTPLLAHAAPNIGDACKDGDPIDSLQCGDGADARVSVLQRLVTIVLPVPSMLRRWGKGVGKASSLLCMTDV